MEIWWLRHAMPSVDPDVPSSDWPLSADGLAAAAALRPLPPPGATLLASPEPKAWQTLETYAGRTCSRDARLREVDRDEPFGRGFRERRRAYVDGVDHPGWEPRAAVAARLQATVDDGLAAAEPDGVLVLGTHGMALTVWLTSVGLLDDPGAFWAGLGFPTLLRLAADPGSAQPPATRVRWLG